MAYLLGMEDEPFGKDDIASADFKVNKVGGKPVIFDTRVIEYCCILKMLFIFRIGLVASIRIPFASLVVGRCC